MCDLPQCALLCFEDGVQLSEHYWVVHQKKKETKLEMGFRDGGGDSDEEVKFGRVKNRL